MYVFVCVCVCKFARDSIQSKHHAYLCAYKYSCVSQHIHITIRLNSHVHMHIHIGIHSNVQLHVHQSRQTRKHIHAHMLLNEYKSGCSISMSTITNTYTYCIIYTCIYV